MFSSNSKLSCSSWLLRVAQDKKDVKIRSARKAENNQQFCEQNVQICDNNFTELHCRNLAESQYKVSVWLRIIYHDLKCNKNTKVNAWQEGG